MKKFLIITALLSLAIFSSSCAASPNDEDSHSFSKASAYPSSAGSSSILAKAPDNSSVSAPDNSSVSAPDSSSSVSSSSSSSISSSVSSSSSSVSSAVLNRRNSAKSPLYICYSLGTINSHKYVLSDDKKTLTKDNIEWLVAPQGYSFSGYYITDEITMYAKILDDKDENSFRWLRACFNHEKCKLNSTVDINLSLADNKLFTYAQDYTLYTDDGFTFKTEKCDFVDEILLTFVNVNAVRPEFIQDYDSSFDKITERFYPFSYLINGKQQLYGTTEWHNPILDRLPSYENFKRVGIAEAFTYNSDKYDNVLSGNGEIAYNGDWDLFPSKMLYRKYDINNQPTRRDWNKAVKKELDAQDSNYAAVVIAESWEFDWNGKRCSVVNANNILLTDYGYTVKYVNGKKTFGRVGERETMPKNVSPSADENPLMYRISILFVEGQPPWIIDYDYDTMDAIFVSDEDKKKNDIYYVYQYNDKKEIIICETDVMYCNRRDLKRKNSFLLCDVDGDHKPELFGLYSELSSLCSIFSRYDLIDGKATSTLAMALR